MAQGINVLLVDDNPTIRELLIGAIAPLATVQAFASAEQAFRCAERHTPDLIISDYRMPGLSGLELLAKLRISFPRVAVIILASRSDIAGPLAGSSPLVEEFIEKPFFVDEAAVRIRRVLDRIALSKATREAADSTSVRGTLAQMSVVDLLQTLDLGRKTCRLLLSHGSKHAQLHFHDGQLLHATLGDIVGEPAVHAVAAWTQGLFMMDFERSECPRTITHSTQSVLLEALRLFDEAQRDSEEAPERPSAQSVNALSTAVGF